MASRLLTHTEQRVDNNHAASLRSMAARATAIVICLLLTAYRSAPPWRSSAGHVDQVVPASLSARGGTITTRGRRTKSLPVDVGPARTARETSAAGSGAPHAAASSSSQSPTGAEAANDTAANVRGGDRTPRFYPPYLAALYETDPAAVAHRRAYERAFSTLDHLPFLRWVADSSMPIPPWRPGVATPIVCSGEGTARPPSDPPPTGSETTRSGAAGWFRVYPGYYSIPHAQVVPLTPPQGHATTASGALRAQPWGTVFPGQSKTYVFTSERAYLADMRRSRFCVNMRKGGWQTARILEMLGMGCVPYYCDLWDSPRHGSTAYLPREVLIATLNAWKGGEATAATVRATCYPRHRRGRDPISLALLNVTMLDRLASKLLEYTAASLTTSFVALHHLSVLDLAALPRRVLVLWTTYPIHPGYLVPSWMHGLKSLGVEVIDFPRQHYLYGRASPAAPTDGLSPSTSDVSKDGGHHPSCEELAMQQKRVWGKGFFIFCRMQESQGEVRLRRVIHTPPAPSSSPHPPSSQPVPPPKYFSRPGEGLGLHNPPPSPTELGNVRALIAARHFDAIIYHFPSESYLTEEGYDPRGPSFPSPAGRGAAPIPNVSATSAALRVEHWPFFAEVRRNYEPGRIAIVNDEDALYDMRRDALPRWLWEHRVPVRPTTAEQKPEASNDARVPLVPLRRSSPVAEEYPARWIRRETNGCEEDIWAYRARSLGNALGDVGWGIT